MLLHTTHRAMTRSYKAVSEDMRNFKTETIWNGKTAGHGGKTIFWLPCPPAKHRIAYS